MSPAPPDYIYLTPLATLTQHRYVVHLRSWTRPDQHRSILLYRSPVPIGTPAHLQKWYSINNECEHLGLPLEHGDIEDLVDDHSDGDDEVNDEPAGPVIVCPFHNYDFDLATGHSSTGMKACAYRVELRDDGALWMEPPGEAGGDYRVLGVREVSERFADPPDSASEALSSTLSSLALSPSPATEPTSIVTWCRLILLAPSPTAKVSLTRHLVSLFRSGTLTRLADPANDPPHPHEPYRSPNVQVVLPGKTASLGKGGTLASRVKLLHSLATIEQWAIDLAVDAVARFHDWRLGDVEGKKGKKLGWEFVSDFLKVAEDEAKHFTLLSSRLTALGTPYGALPVHSGLWESALETSHSLFARLAIVALVHEARGLDTNPLQIRRARSAGDEETARTLEVIHWDEISHVAAGHRHFTRLCAALSPPADPVSTFRVQVQQHFHGAVRGPFNAEDREKAGLERGWYEELGGRGTVGKGKGKGREVRVVKEEGKGEKAGEGKGEEKRREVKRVEVGEQ
ncbi:hypothetical protein JCM10207_004069 [Rhodosporidiobolus poonsookiae]